MFIDATADTPKIDLNEKDQTITIIGKSFPEDAFEFYNDVEKWICSYFNENSNTNTTINFELIYYNSTTTKLLYDFFHFLTKQEGHTITINWYYDKDNDFSYESGEELAEEFSSLTINLIQI